MRLEKQEVYVLTLSKNECNILSESFSEVDKELKQSLMGSDSEHKLLNDLWSEFDGVENE